MHFLQEGEILYQKSAKESGSDGSNSKVPCALETASRRCQHFRRDTQKEPNRKNSEDYLQWGFYYFKSDSLQQPVCVNCNEIQCTKPFILQRHFTTKHNEQLKALRQTVFRKTTSEHSSVFRHLSRHRKKTHKLSSRSLCFMLQSYQSCLTTNWPAL